ncbi:hypothetical protein DCAR_0521570 [Daucus carota subsp. sativus]|uniref:Uncharacterized protein n=1 Tax=Daucus carota subsp. sativus TaxID=79200 RepID=A0AAF1B334_DAUCS|nr:PREDICTED: uncharacterized protein LOC108221737 [Daucus carota subsp. sativus]WOH02182.1 hypothetical protein DCAR_0521570 [Daucus carota subsp. sativus]
MQRLSTTSRVPKDHHSIDLEKQGEEEEVMEKPPRWFSSRCKSSSYKTSPASLKLIHILPLIVLLCLFILWYFSYPVNLEIKDGRLTRIKPVVMSRSLNESRVDLTILAKAASPNVSVSDMLIAYTATAPQPRIGTD